MHILCLFKLWNKLSQIIFSPDVAEKIFISVVANKYIYIRMTHETK